MRKGFATMFCNGLPLLLLEVLTLLAAVASSAATTTAWSCTAFAPPLPPTARYNNACADGVSPRRRSAQRSVLLRPLCSTTSVGGSDGGEGAGGGAAAAAAATASANSLLVVVPTPLPRPPCYYRSNNRWFQRIELADLSVGQKLTVASGGGGGGGRGVPVGISQEKLAGAKTGPKLWLDVGVGRYSPKRGTWKMCTAMLRLGAGYVKESVARKKAARVRAKIAEHASSSGGGLSVYVSRVRLEQDQFEVVLSEEDLVQYTAAASLLQQRLQSVSKLSPGDLVTGTVVRVEDYGVLVAIDGYNRAGLLHIQRVADLYGGFIDKKIGLEDAGLERGARVKLQVADNVQKKRLFLDFTNDVKEEAAAEQRKEEEDEERKREETRARLQQHRQAFPVTAKASVAEPAASSVAPAVSSPGQEPLSLITSEAEDRNTEEEDEYDEDEYDDYDEERDIEDALGLGTY